MPDHSSYISSKVLRRSSSDGLPVVVWPVASESLEFELNERVLNGLLMGPEGMVCGAGR